MKKWILPLAIILLFAVEIAGVYFLMPLPGSQYNNTVNIAWFFYNNNLWIRIFLLILIIWQIFKIIKHKKFLRLTFSVLFLVLYIALAWFINFKMQADVMFYQPENKIFLSREENKILPGALIIGVEINGEARAYPIELIGYHHQVIDTVGNKPIMVTYCTVCRTGRIFDPEINGKQESFRLVGMDHFNAMFEDASTGSWWRQATGEAITGPLKGEKLSEIFSEQMTLQAWLRKYPDSKIMQPDPVFSKQYEALSGFDDGTIESELEGRDIHPFQFKSWVVSITVNEKSKAYDWNDLLKLRVINDKIDDTEVLLVIESDQKSFHSWSRKTDTLVLDFYGYESDTFFIDNETKSLWNYEGFCIEGKLKGLQLTPIKSSQEFYHAWKKFNPEGEEYKN